MSISDSFLSSSFNLRLLKESSLEFEFGDLVIKEDEAKVGLESVLRLELESELYLFEGNEIAGD